jgi:asparagine synthase (glutamine-hydrolysing)
LLAYEYSDFLWVINRAAGHCRNRKIGKYQKIARRINAESLEDLFSMMNARHHSKHKLVLDSTEPKSIFNDHADLIRSGSRLRNLQYIDYVNYLVNDVMTKVDRASMSVSLETRSPLLDYRILELAWSFPDSYLVNQKDSKYVLKRILNKYLPRKLVDRPKQGFGVPINEWLKSDLNEWASDLLSSSLIKNQGIFDSKWVKYYWDQQSKGCAKHDNLIWSLLMFQSWHEHTKAQ